MEPDAPSPHDAVPSEPSVEDTREALRRRAAQARSRSSRLRQDFRATVQESTVRREHDHAVEHAIACAAHAGDLAARDALVRRYAPVLSAHARHLSVGSSTPHAELLSAGMTGLLLAIDGWNPASDVTFREYAVPRTHAAIQIAAT
jgi:DNA-directed RNA polymerase sigma subunit (sigma70/sigma32)